MPGDNTNPNATPPAGTVMATPAPASNIPVVPPTQSDFVTQDQLRALRDTINGITGSMRQDLNAVRSEVANGFTTLTGALGQLTQQPATPPIQQPVIPVTQPSTPALPTSPQRTEEPSDALMRRVMDLETQVRTSARILRLNTIAPELAANPDVVTLVSTSSLPDDQLFNIISGLRTTLSVRIEETADVTPTVPVTEPPATAAAATSTPGVQTPPVARGNDIPDGVPAVNSPFAHAGETTQEQMTNLINSGDVAGAAALIDEQIKTGAISTTQTLGQANRAVR